MLSNYLKVAIKVLLRRKFYTAVNTPVIGAEGKSAKAKFELASEFLFLDLRLLCPVP